MTQPHPPAHLLQRIANNPSATDFVNSFGPLREIVKGYLKEAGFEFNQFKSILDFGCGVGRFMFAFQPELATDQKIWGCDVYEECARWCQENIPFADVTKSEIEPPLPYRDDQFDLVCSLSVYTHLRLDMQFRWAWEIYRVLRPGGVLFATIHGPFFIPMFYETLRASARDAELYSFGDDSLFAYLSFSGKSEDEGQVHVASAHTPGFFREQFSAFELVQRVPQSRLAGGQDLYIIRKPLHGRSINRPITLMTGPEQVVWTQEITEGAGTESVLLKFNSNGHRMLRVFPCVEPAGVFGVACKVIVKADNNVLVQKESPFNNNRVFGRTHYGIIEIGIPEYQGEMTVELSARIIEQGTLPDGNPISVYWSFPTLT
jgi:SAM-dependent methyltransferase